MTPRSQPPAIGHHLWALFFTLLTILILIAVVLITSSRLQVAAVAALPTYTPQSLAEAHPEANAVRACTENGNSTMTFKHLEFNNRYAWLCQLPDGSWGIHVLEKVGDAWEEVTAFVREQARASNDATAYLRSTGFTTFSGPLP